jgi:hypothetical protein
MPPGDPRLWPGRSPAGGPRATRCGTAPSQARANQEESPLQGESSVSGRRGSPLLVLELVIAEGEPLSGTVGLAGGSPVAFRGWIDLMSAISALRAAAGDPAIPG